MDFNECSIYLPQYLSSNEKKILFKDLEKFPTDGTKGNIYTSALQNTTILLQADGIKEVPYLNFPDTKIKNTSVILLSNTCDMSLENKRQNACKIMYAPLINYSKYEALLKKTIEKEKVEQHLKDLKNQKISQALYLPKGINLTYDAIVFFDRTISIPLEEKIVNKMCTNKLFTLSNFGFYLFLIKLSIHFTRVQEKIDRNILSYP